jgi:serine/threonine-protein kinase RsbW
VIKKELSIPANINFLAEVREFIQRTGRDHRFSNMVINAVMLSAEEALTNIIRHGYSNISNGMIHIEAIIRRLSFEIAIIDQGEFFDPRSAVRPAVAELADVGKKGGLGIMMIRKLMDEIDYFSGERGNEFRLTKYRETFSRSKLFPTWQYIRRNKSFLLAALINLMILTGFVLILFYI